MKILCFGSINIDSIYKVPYFVEPGETLLSKSLSNSLGGKGCNQAVAMVKAGASVYLAGCIKSTDKWIIDELNKIGVKTKYIEKVKTSTGHAIIQVNDTGENAIILCPGANHTISESYIDKVLKGFEKGDFLVIQNEINNIELLINKAFKKKMKIFFNPAPMTKETLDFDLEKVTCLFVNEKEGSMLSNEKCPESIVSKLKKKFPNITIVLTLGNKGAIYSSNLESIHIKIRKVNVIDTVGAGDTFIGFFIAMVSNQISIKRSMEIACEASVISVTRKSGLGNIPLITEIENVKVQ